MGELSRALTAAALGSGHEYRELRAVRDELRLCGY